MDESYQKAHYEALAVKEYYDKIKKLEFGIYIRYNSTEVT